MGQDKGVQNGRTNRGLLSLGNHEGKKLLVTKRFRWADCGSTNLAKGED